MPHNYLIVIAYNNTKLPLILKRNIQQTTVRYNYKMQLVLPSLQSETERLEGWSAQVKLWIGTTTETCIYVLLEYL